MKTSLHTRLSILLFAFIAIMTLMPSQAGAQKRIADIVDHVTENGNQRNNIIYVEKRNPQTKKIWKRTYVIQWNNDPSIEKKLLDAFRQESKNSVEYTVVNGTVYTIKFKNAKSSSTYVLVNNPNDGTWMLTRKEINYENMPDNPSGNAAIDKFEDLDDFNDLDGIDEFNFRIGYFEI